MAAMKNFVEKDDQDLILVKRITAGDEQAFEELVRRYQHSVLNIINRYIGNYNEAEDIAQEVFIKVWRKIRSFKGKSKFSTWLYRIVVNQCIDYKRKNKEELVSLDKRLAEGNLPLSLTVEFDCAKETMREILRKVIQELPANQRIALILSKFEGRSYQAIAEIMGISLSAVESLIHRAKNSLKDKLRPLREKGKI